MGENVCRAQVTFLLFILFLLDLIIPYHTSFVKYQDIVIGAFVYFLHELNTLAKIKRADELLCWACF